MDRVRRYGVGTGSFFRWWRQALASWLPARWRVLLGLARDRLLLVRHGEEVQLRWQNGAGVHALAQLPLPLQDADLERVLANRLAALPRWLALPPAMALRRRLLLPGAALERLRDVVGFEVDRQTPFSAAAVCFDARLLQRRDDGQLDVELVVVPRAAFDEALGSLGGLAAGLVGVDVLDDTGLPLEVNLLPEAQRRRRSNPMRTWNLVLGAVAVAAIIAAAWQVLENRREAVLAFDAEVEAKALQARQVALQRDRLRNIVEGARFLDEARAGRPTTVEVIDEVSRRLPDNTYLEKLAIEGDRLLLIGLSPEASALVGRLEGSSLWKSPALSGALQPDPRTRRDRFSLTADLVGTLPAKPATEAANGAPAR
ncbi:MAG: general secretion pathway protein GspL [Lysobacteraceae bacterium]|nr:MAG: general secretion pathway protein GspL [Xanthomonadaceae bacterium]